MKIGDRIRQFRKAKGITQKELAEALNVKTAAVSKYETGTVIPSYDTVLQIANFFNVHISVFLDNIDILQFDTGLQNKLKGAMELMTIPQELRTAFANLNEDGQNKVIEYANDITPKYKK